MHLGLLLTLLFLGGLLQKAATSERRSQSAKKTLPAATSVEPAAAALPAHNVPDDFTQIKGIGLQINQQLQAAGITTFSQLAEVPLNRLIEIVGEPRMFLHLWSEQARLAATGDWQALKAYQADL